jgi:hypothetical protein
VHNVGKVQPVRAVHDASVISAAPIKALLQVLRADTETVKKWSPNGEAVSTLERVAGMLEEALREARRADVWLTVDEVATVTHRQRSTISRICRDHRALAGAQKIEGSWSIHWPTFEEFLLTREPQPNQEAA